MSGKHSTLERRKKAAPDTAVPEPEQQMPDPDNLPIDTSVLTGPIAVQKI